MAWTTIESQFDYLHKRSFISKTSRPALFPSHFPTQSVSDDLSPEVKSVEHKGDHSHPPMLRLRTSAAITLVLPHAFVGYAVTLPLHYFRDMLYCRWRLNVWRLNTVAQTLNCSRVGSVRNFSPPPPPLSLSLSLSHSPLLPVWYDAVTPFSAQHKCLFQTGDTEP
jgi:hypothetical protein